MKIQEISEKSKEYPMELKKNKRFSEKNLCNWKHRIITKADDCNCGNKKMYRIRKKASILF